MPDCVCTETKLSFWNSREYSAILKRTEMSQEVDTEESSDDDISYGSDDSSVDGDIKDEIRCSLTEDDSLFSDEEIFSEEEGEYDLGTRVVRTYEMHDCFLSPYNFDQPLYTISEDEDDIDDNETLRIIEESQCDDDLLAIIEEAELPRFDPLAADFSRALDDEQDYDYDLDSFTNYHSSCTIFVRDLPTRMTSLVDDNQTLFTITEEPELEEICEIDTETETEEKMPPTDPEDWSKVRQANGPPESFPSEAKDCNFDIAEALPDLDTLISNLEASLAGSDFIGVEKEYSSDADNTHSSNRQSQVISISQAKVKECRQDLICPSFGIPLLSLKKNLTLR